MSEVGGHINLLAIFDGLAADGGAAFPDILRLYRLNAGLSQEALAEAAGISVAAVSSYEGGVRRAPPRHTFLALAYALGLSEERRRRFQSLAANRANLQRNR